MQRCKKVWTCYNRLSFGPLENLSTDKESLVSLEDCGIFYSPSFPLCVSLHFIYSGDILDA